jgi:hypothetical protein
VERVERVECVERREQGIPGRQVGGAAAPPYREEGSRGAEGG